MVRNGSCEDTRVACQTYRLTEIETILNGKVNFCERRRCEPLGSLGACSPRKDSNLVALKRHFQHSRADSCVVKVPAKIDRYFLLKFGKRALSSAVKYFQN